MADNSTLPATGDVIASDDISSVKYQRIKLVFGADGSNDGDVDDLNPLPTFGITMISTEFTRPSDTTAYAANDVVSDSTSATTMQALAGAARGTGGGGYITGIRVTTDKKSITPRFRVHFYNTTGATLAADNANMKTIYADNSKYVGWWDMPAMITGADTTNSTNSYSEDLTVRIPYTCAATSLYYVLETLDAFTPASAEKVTVSVFVDRS